MKTIFREYDIRGLFQKELNEEIVKRIGYFLGKKLKIGNESVVIAIGYDGREHSETINSWLLSGLNFAGVEIISIGLTATPVSHFCNYYPKLNINGSIMITGSHNGKEYNGFKITYNKKAFFGEEIYKLRDEVLSSNLNIKDNVVTKNFDMNREYVEYLYQQFKGLNVDKKFILDPGNGTAGIILKPLSKKLNLNVEYIFDEVDGTFPNHHPDPSVDKNLEDIQRKLNIGNFDFGFAYDGDSDRVVFLDKNRRYLAEELAIFFAKNIENPIVVGEVKATNLFFKEINKIGKALINKTGHSNLRERVAKENASMSADISGHFSFNDRYFGFDDGIYTTLRVLELIEKGFNFNEEFTKLPKVYSTPEIKIEVEEVNKFSKVQEFIKLFKEENFPNVKEIIEIDGARIEFLNGWALVRASNTSPCLTLRFEGDCNESLNEIQKIVENILKKVL